MFKILVTTKFRDRVVNYVQTVCELVGTMRGSARHATTVTNSSRTAHVEYTVVHELVRVAAWPCLPTDTVMCTSRIDGTSSLRLVYALHEQFAHGTSSSRLLRDSGARVGVGVYI
jgi:hypothetical protein